MSEPLLSVKNMKKTFQANGGMFSKKKFVHAVNDVSFDIYPGETFSLVGESGCGKSTTGKLIDHLITPDSGEIWFEGKEISKLSEKEMRPLRSDIQMVFQDPYGSLNPRMKVQDLIGEPLLIHTNMSAEMCIRDRDNSDERLPVRSEGINAVRFHWHQYLQVLFPDLYL